jgi:hypothetical protein
MLQSGVAAAGVVEALQGEAGGTDVRIKGWRLKILVIGGVIAAHDDTDYPRQLGLLRTAMREVGAKLRESRHELLVCSPFEGAADVEALRGFANAGVALKPETIASVEIHHPDDDKVTQQVDSSVGELPLIQARTFRHPLTKEGQGGVNWQYSWLLAQLAALDRCHALIAIGGNPSGSASLLLNLAEVKRFPILPLAYLEGAAQEYLTRHRYELRDRLGDRSVDELYDLGLANNVVRLVETLAEKSLGKQTPAIPHRYFLSYSRKRQAEADFVEMTLRRRNCEVFRDERSFEPGHHLPSEVTDNIHGADVFIALWCQEYACSPWCYDELNLALDRAESGQLSLWLLSIDDTRMVPPRARPLIGYTCLNRSDLESRISNLIDNMKSARDV